MTTGRRRPPGRDGAGARRADGAVVLIAIGPGVATGIGRRLIDALVDVITGPLPAPWEPWCGAGVAGGRRG